MSELEAAGHVAIPAPRGADADLWDVSVARAGIVAAEVEEGG